MEDRATLCALLQSIDCLLSELIRSNLHPTTTTTTARYQKQFVSRNTSKLIHTRQLKKKGTRSQKEPILVEKKKKKDLDVSFLSNFLLIKRHNCSFIPTLYFAIIQPLFTLPPPPPPSPLRVV